MPAYGCAMFVIGFSVHILLLSGVNKLFHGNTSHIRRIIGAVLSGVYNSVCLLPQLYILANPVLRVTWLLIVAMIAFGCALWSFRPIVVYLFLCFIIDLMSDTKELDMRSLVIVSSLVFVVCLLVNNQNYADHKYIPVELTYGKVSLRLTALRDTGNHLHDPITGKPVLVVDANAARELTGLTSKQLRSPVETLGVIPGLRLIPYKVIGGSGFLLALSIPKVKIGTWQGSGVVAFAPDIFHGAGKYQALTGGNV